MILRFSTSLFRPFLPDARQVNPNVLGYELAHWLARELAQREIFTSYPQSEDWGWFLEYELGGQPALICCSGSAEDDAHEWTVFIMKPKRLFKKSSTTHAEESAILTEIAELLQGAQITVQREEEAAGA